MTATERRAGSLSRAVGDLSRETEVNGENGGLPAGLPMPRNRALLSNVEARPRITRFEGTRYPFPVPNGWFVVAESGSLRDGDVRALYYFGRNLVLFRTESGEARVLDAHCMHLGANLAVGGRVEGECIRCPFHGWMFEGQLGHCVEIPYGDVKRIPPKAHSRSYPTLERNHMIWVWYHAEGKEPFYEVPEVPEFHDENWSPILVAEFEVASSCQDMAENNVDFAHFRYVHGTEAIPDDDLFTDGTYKRTISGGGAFVREGFGLGLGVLRVENYVTFLSSTAPIDEDHVHVRWIFTAPRANGPDAVEGAADSFLSGVSQDLPIWENKVYRDPPVITKTEKLILEHRRWCQQFYSVVEQ